MTGARIIRALSIGALALAGMRCEQRESHSARAEAEVAAAPLVTWQAPVRIASGLAHVGPWRMNESDFRFVADPTVGFTPRGDLGVAWVDNQQKDIFFRRYDRSGKPLDESPVNVSRSADVFSWLPRLVMTGDDEVFLLWQEITFSGGSHGGDLHFARSRDGGVSFEEPINLSQSTAGAGKGRLAKELWDNGSLAMSRSPDGTLFVAWTEYEGALRVIRSTDAGATFTEPLHVAGNEEQPARGPALATGAGGLIYLAWTFGQEPSGNLRLSMSEDCGETFQEVTLPVSSEGHADAPQIALDRRGAVHLVYGERGENGRSAVVYTRKEGEAFTPPRVLSAADDGSSASFPGLALDVDRGVYVTWDHAGSPNERPRGLGWSGSMDGGQTFSAPTLIPGTDDPILGVQGNLQGRLTDKLAVAEDGRIAVVNSYFLPQEQSLVQLFLGTIDRLPGPSSRGVSDGSGF